MAEEPQPPPEIGDTTPADEERIDAIMNRIITTIGKEKVADVVTALATLLGMTLAGIPDLELAKAKEMVEDVVMVAFVEFRS